MAEYVKDHMHTYISDKDTLEPILLDHPVPYNICSPQKLDEFLIPLLKNYDIDCDSTLTRLQHKAINIMGPLSKVWKMYRGCQKPSGRFKRTPTVMLHGVETRSELQCNRCSSTKLVESLPICIPIFQFDRSRSNKNNKGWSATPNTNNTSLANSSLVCQSFTNVNETQYLVTNRPGEKVN